MTLPIPVTSQSKQYRVVREATPGTLPAGAMTIMPMKDVKLNGGAPTRTRSGNVVTSGNVPANPVTGMVDPTVTANSDHLYSHYNIFYEEVLGLAMAGPVTFTATDIAAVVSGNKLTSATSWIVSGFQIGDFVLVSGFVTNAGPFLARVSGAPTATDLPLDHHTLSAESAGPSVTVSYVGRFRVGNTFLSHYAELFSSAGSWGQKLPYASMHTLTLNFDNPGMPSIAWQGLAGQGPVSITSALANTSNALGAQYPMDIAIGFGARLATNLGGGLHYGGVPYANVRTKKLSISIAHPKVVSPAGAGQYGPAAVFINDAAVVKVELDIHNDCADARQLLADAYDPATVASLGFPWRDPNGKIEYWHFAKLDPDKGEEDGLKQQGEAMFSFSWMAHDDSSHTSVQRTLLN